MKEERKEDYPFLPEPIPVTEQQWPDDVKPLVQTRTMAYNHEAYIEECIQGFLIQKTTFRVQLCIHDDASTDRTAEIIRSYEDKYPGLIRAYYQPVNTYRSERRNELIKPFFDWFTSEYIAICEGDDYWIDEKKLEIQYDFMKNNPNCVYSFHAVKDKDEETGKFFPHRNDKISRYFSTSEIILGGGGLIGTQSVMLKLKRPNIDSMPDFMKLGPAGDYTMVLYAATIGDIYYIDRTMAVYRMNVKNSHMTKLKTISVEGYIQRHFKTILMLESFNLYTNGEYEKDIKLRQKMTLVRTLSYHRRKGILIRLKYLYSNIKYLEKKDISQVLSSFFPSKIKRLTKVFNK